jgi:ferritin
MLSKKIQDALNEQINAEMWSAYLYLSMAAYCHSIGRSGFANWYEVQFQEEQDHAKILFNFIASRDGRIELKPIAAVQQEWNSLLECLEDTLSHEQKVTAMINNLYALTKDENDFATQSRLQWFIDEQVEEEENAKDIINHLKMVGEDGYGLYMLDKEMGARIYNQTTALSE